MMEIDRLAADLYRLGDKSVTELRKCVIIVVGLLLLLLLFLKFSVLAANPKKLLYTVANPACGRLNREKRTKEKVW